MTPSIRRFLLFYLLLAITVISSLTFVGNYFFNRNDIRQAFDLHLKQIAALVISPIESTERQHYAKKMPKLIVEKIHLQNSQPATLLFQLWNNKTGNLILKSAAAPKTALTQKTGFTDIKIQNKSWRVFSRYDKHYNCIVQVAESYNLQNSLEQRIIWNYLQVLLITYLLLGISIWLIVGYGLRSLKVLAKKLSSRPTTDFSPIHLKNPPEEIKPLIDELNNLFARLLQTFIRNKRFSADAAHELRTPLAALKTQAQVALLTTDNKKRKQLIQKVILGANRCTHLVQQLLTLSRLGKESTLEDMTAINLSAVTTEVILQLAPDAMDKNIELEFIEPNEHRKTLGNETSLSILVRNLVDNAIRYTPDNGTITVKIYNQKNSTTLQVIDSGPGIPQKLHSRVFERFYRILGTKETGSGLGLPIVKQIADLHNAKVKLGSPKNRTGLNIEVIFPAKKS